MVGYYFESQNIKPGKAFYNGEMYVVLDYDYYHPHGKLVLAKPDGCGCRMNFFGLAGFYDMTVETNYANSEVLDYIFTKELHVQKYIGLFYVHGGDELLEALNSDYEYYELHFADLDGIVYDSFMLYTHNSDIFMIALGHLYNGLNVMNTLELVYKNATKKFEVKLYRLRLESIRLNRDI